MKRKRNPHRVQAVDSAKEKTHMPVATTSHSRCLQQNRGKNSPGAGRRPHGPQAPPSPCSLPSANARGPGTALATLPDSLLLSLYLRECSYLLNHRFFSFKGCFSFFSSAFLSLLCWFFIFPPKSNFGIPQSSVFECLFSSHIQSMDDLIPISRL